MEGTALRFASVARTLGDRARAEGLRAPAFRSPPGVEGVHRTVRHHRGGVSVAVRLRGRPWPAVVADMVEGVVVANRLTGVDAARVRTALWAALDEHQSASGVTAAA